MSETRSIGSPARYGATGGKRKRTLYLVGAGVGVIGVWYYLQRRKATTATADATATDPSATDTTGLDTGFSPALTSYTDPATGAVISGGGWSDGAYSLPGTTVTAPGTNAQWAQLVTAYLVQQGFDPITVEVALGKYLANRNLSNTELEIIQAAIAVEGQPPTAVPPPHVAPPSGQTSTNTVTSSVTKPGTPTGLHIASKEKGTAVLAWNAVKGANEYRLHLNGIPVRMVPHASATVHRNGRWQVASVRGAYTSKYSTAVEVKGI